MTAAQADDLFTHFAAFHTLHLEMRPVRNILSRVRLKLVNFGLDILTLFETGYVLSPNRRRR